MYKIGTKSVSVMYLSKSFWEGGFLWVEKVWDFAQRGNFTLHGSIPEIIFMLAPVDRNQFQDLDKRIA